MREKRKKETKISPKKKEGKKKRPPVTKPIDSTRTGIVMAPKTENP